MTAASRTMVLLGKSLDDNGHPVLAGIPLDDWKTHALVIGTTGSGKSTLLRNVAVQTFGLNATTCIVEPHGDLCLDALAGVPDSELSRVVYLSLDSAQPPAIPLMTFGLGGGVDVGMGAVLSVIRMAEPQSWDASTRMREVLRHAVRVILDTMKWNASIVALDRFLTKDQELFREKLLTNCSDEVARSREFCRDELNPALEGAKGTAGMQESIRAARRRLEIFTNDQRLRRTLALPPLGPRVNMAELLTGGRLVLVPVNAAELGSQVAPLVSMLIMQMVKTAFLGRTDRTQRQQAVIIMDEFAAMAESEVAEIVDTLLREARKFGAAIILATQSINQLSNEVKKNVSINTNQKIVLLVSDPNEAAEAAKILGSDQINDTDIRNMPKYHGYVKAMADKAPQPPCLLQMYPPQALAPTRRLDLSQLDLTRPDVSAEWQHVRALAKEAADPNDLRAADPVVTYLREMDEPTWQGVVSDAMAWNRYHAHRLLADPSLEPDKVARAKKISRGLYGLPWWLREAFYWRTLNEGKRKPGRPKGAGVDKAPEPSPSFQQKACPYCTTPNESQAPNCVKCGAPFTLTQPSTSVDFG